MINRKLVVTGVGGGSKVYMDSQARPFSRLGNDDFLDTADICTLFGVSARTVYRWTADGKLRWDIKVGREWLFSKDDVLDFYEDNRPPLGRPRKKGK